MDERPMLHGTDGIRGLVTKPAPTDIEALEAIVIRREVNGRAFRTIGQAIGEELVEMRAAGQAADGAPRDPTIARLASADPRVRVVIGWDRRPGNAMLVAGLTEGLHLAGVKVVHGGEVATPGLHDAILGNAADAGLMVTASHNPADDSGVKLLDADGRKSLPDLEKRIAARAWQLASAGDDALPDPELCRPDTLLPAIAGHRATLAKRFDIFAARLGTDVTKVDWASLLAPCGLLIDSSGGASTEWLAAGLARRGIRAIEVGDTAREINERCGAGGLSPTDVWTYDALLERAGCNGNSKHALIDAIAAAVGAAGGIPEWTPGTLIGAALDGDGDRCLLVESTDFGIRVVDGDRMADDWLRALEATRDDDGDGASILAATIESDLALPASLDRLSPQPRFVECAVGDRWLAEALAPPAGAASRLLKSNTLPESIGCEDSGHIVLPSPHPRLEGHWSLVGDGAATLLAMLCARAALAYAGSKAPLGFVPGWKKRVSIRGSDRSRWTGSNKLADAAARFIHEHLKEVGAIDEWERCGLTGERDLMLIRADIDGADVSIGIRNSGTEAKTSISIRAATDFPDLGLLLTLCEGLEDLLRERLVP